MTKKKDKKLEKLYKTLNLNEEIIRGNKKEFEFKENKYRVRMPNTGDEIEVEEKKNELYVQLLNDKKYLTKEQLIEVYKKKKINIPELDDEFKKIHEQMKEEMIKMAKIPSESKDVLKNYVLAINNLQIKLKEISRKKVNLLQYSIESKVEHYYFLYLSYLVTEKLDNKNWVKCWKDFEEFKKADSELTGLSMIWATRLLAGIKNPIFEV